MNHTIPGKPVFHLPTPGIVHNVQHSVLEEIDRLWGEPEDTPEGDRLDVLLVLVENYESKHHSIDPLDPIEAIKNKRVRLGDGEEPQWRIFKAGSNSRRKNKRI